MITLIKIKVMSDDKHKYSELTSKIIGCSMKVHSALGNGFQEMIYQRSLAIEMETAGLNFQREYEMPSYYDKHLVGTRRVDFIVEKLSDEFSFSDVQQSCPGISFSTLKRSLQQLKKKNIIRTIGKGRDAKYRK